MDYITRRKFVKTASGALGAIPVLGLGNMIPQLRDSSPEISTIHLFSKHLQFLNYEDMAEAAAEMGFDGLDLTVRPEGHVLPERVTQDLPVAVEAMKNFGLKPLLMTTNVTDAADPHSRTILETAGKLGIKNYRTGWLTYPGGEVHTRMHCGICPAV